MSSTPTQTGSYAIGILLVFAATVCWSLAGLFVRHLPGLDGWQINGGRGLSLAVSMALWLMILHGRRLPQVVTALPPFALIAFSVQFTLGSTLYALALTLAPTANVSCIGATSPVMTAVLAATFLGERANRWTLLSAVLALSGVAYIVQDGLEAGSLLGNLAAFGAVACWSVQATLLRGYRHYDMMPALVVAGLLTFAVAVIASGGFSVPTSAILPLAAMGVIQLAVPIVLFARGARTVPAVTASLVLLLDAVLNPLWTFIGVGEQPPMASYVGGAIIIVAVAITILTGRRDAQTATS
ncbi:MAG: DMT family transporter [Labrys sp. (in: a-proteobacteria)]